MTASLRHASRGRRFYGRVGVRTPELPSPHGSVDTPTRVTAAALAIGVLYLAGLILIHRLAG